MLQQQRRQRLCMPENAACMEWKLQSLALLIEFLPSPSLLRGPSAFSLLGQIRRVSSLGARRGRASSRRAGSVRVSISSASGSTCQATRSFARYLAGPSPGGWAQVPIAIVFRIQVSFDLQSEEVAQRSLRGAQWPEPTLVRLSQRTSLHSIPSGQGLSRPGEPHSEHLSPGFSGGAISGGGNL
jgi:hypothetical protein